MFVCWPTVITQLSAGELIQNSTLKRGGLFESRAYSREGAYSRVGLIRERGLIQKSGKCVAKGPKKRLEVLKNELDRIAIKLNHMKLDIGVIMKKLF